MAALDPDQPGSSRVSDEYLTCGFRVRFYPVERYETRVALPEEEVNRDPATLCWIAMNIGTPAKGTRHVSMRRI
jgi:hypothetical protein